MEYIISSGGRPIGTTALGFFTIDDSSRSGWFHPNAAGEALMPNAAILLPAMRAFLCRHVHDADGQSLVPPSARQSSLFADLAEAFHRVAALDLTLHRADGTLIPTSMIGIQDTEQLLELSRWNDLDGRSDPLIAEEAAYEEFDDELEEGVQHDLDSLREGWRAIDADPLDASFEDGLDPNEEVTRWPRYQVHVLLAEGSAIA